MFECKDGKKIQAEIKVSNTNLLLLSCKHKYFNRRRQLWLKYAQGFKRTKNIERVQTDNIFVGKH